ncbi:ribosome maturation factor RimP [Nakamurella flava]|uniref:Ribosome maturation factor RimP n=1 Tax=Nakamurella flava TaxID=2576308 RepID=A0A4U6QKV9_9ACTN|nr:ribosome maturation factor RimP [Nakamurella flava]TKV60971.1 ribosome maturation factor RimP [Nakamurella flava]
MPAADERRLRQVIEPLVTGAGFDLEALTVQTAGRRRVVKVIVDSDEGVDLDRAAALSRAISAELDTDDAVLGAAAYVLEVTSPGVGRPLSAPRHFRRSRRRLLVVTTADGRTVTGHLLRVVEPGPDGAPAGITLLVGPKAEEQLLGWDDVVRARVEVEFSSAPAAVRDRLDAELGPVAPAAPIALDDDEPDDDSDDEPDDDVEADELDVDELDDTDDETDEHPGDGTTDVPGGQDEGAHR